MEKKRTRLTKKQDGFYQYRFMGENKEFWEAIMGDHNKPSKFLIEILNTLQHYHKNKPGLIITFFGIPFYEKYFGHIDDANKQKDD